MRSLGHIDPPADDADAATGATDGLPASPGCDHSPRAAVAQLVEQGTFNPRVVGSSPTGGMMKYL
jgi:hypothetical protein